MKTLKLGPGRKRVPPNDDGDDDDNHDDDDDDNHGEDDEEEKEENIEREEKGSISPLGSCQYTAPSNYIYAIQSVFYD